MSHLEWSDCIPTIEKIPLLVSCRKIDDVLFVDHSINPCHLCQDVVQFIKARREEGVKQGLQNDSLIQFIKSREVHKSDPSLELSSDFTSYSVTSYMYYINNASIQVYEKQARRFSQGEFASYLDLVKDTINKISNEEVEGIRDPNEEGNADRRHSARISALPSRMVDTYVQQERKRSYREMSNQSSRSGPTQHSSSGQSSHKMSCDQFWRIIDSSFFKPIPKINEFMPPHLPKRMHGMISGSESSVTYYSWENPDIALMQSYPEIKFLFFFCFIG